jgi:hypothetical protein
MCEGAVLVVQDHYNEDSTSTSTTKTPLLQSTPSSISIYDLVLSEIKKS